MRWPKSEGRRSVDFYLGRGARNSSSRNTAASMSGASAKEGEARDNASLRQRPGGRTRAAVQSISTIAPKRKNFAI